MVCDSYFKLNFYLCVTGRKKFRLLFLFFNKKRVVLNFVPGKSFCLTLMTRKQKEV